MKIKLYSAGVDVNPVDQFGHVKKCEYVDLLANGGSAMKAINKWLGDEPEYEKERGLMYAYPAGLIWQREYGGDRYSESVNGAVNSLRMSLDVFKGRPVMVATLDTARDLADDEIKNIKGYLFGQMSEGWGEGVEQDRIPLGNGERGRLNVPLEFFTEDEIKEILT
jgi:hypothetical protein